MIRLFTVLILIFSASAKNCHKNNSVVSDKYQFAVSFGSKCCGTASDNFLKEFLTKFNNENKNILKADIVKGCGREGEFIILIRFLKQDALLRSNLEQSLSDVIEKENQKKSAANDSSGYVTLIKDPQEQDYEFCRIPVATWLK